MTIRILGKTERAGFYQFCFVAPSPRKEKAARKTKGSDPADEENPAPEDAWTNQAEGGNDAYDSGGRELRVGAIYEADVTPLGRMVKGAPLGGPS